MYPMNASEAAWLVVVKVGSAVVTLVANGVADERTTEEFVVIVGDIGFV
jgi:hypothetical protein